MMRRLLQKVTERFGVIGRVDDRGDGGREAVSLLFFG